MRALLSLLLVVYGASAEANWLRRLCDGVRGLRTSEIERVDREIARGLLTEPWREDGRAAQLVDQASTLTEPEVARLLAGGVQEKTRGELLHLALHDGAAWDRFIARVAVEGLESESFFRSLQPAIERMPAALKDRLAKRIGEVFDRVEKKLEPGRIGPRRALEGFLRIAYPADAIIGRAIKGGASPMQALEGYHRLMREKVFAGTSRTAYSTEDVGTAMLTTLGTLRADAKAARLAGRRVDEYHSLIMYGSFVNGFASKESDLDAMVRSTDLKKLAGPINDNIAHVLALRGKPHSPKIVPENFFIAAFQDTMASYSPVMFEIKENEVNLLVYGTKIAPNGEGQSEVKEAPARYRVFPK